MAANWPREMRCTVDAVRAVKMITPAIEMIMSSMLLLSSRFSRMATSRPHVAIAR